MSRVPDVPAKPIRPLVTLADYRDAGWEIISVCSTTQHQHLVDFDAQIAKHGLEVRDSQAWRAAQICPECGAPGGGIIVNPSSAV